MGSLTCHSISVSDRGVYTPVIDAEFGQAFPNTLIRIYYWLIVLVNNSLKMWVNDCKLQLKSDKRWKYVWTVFMNTRPTSQKHEFATKKVSSLNTYPTQRPTGHSLQKNVNHSIYHQPYYQRPKINRAEFTNKIVLWTTLLNTHPSSENQQGCIWIYDYFMSFRIYHPPYFQRRETQQQLQAQQLFSVSLSLAVH